MAQLLLEWLNEKVVLNSKVVSFSEDFKDGYLLGNILYKFNQQINFNEFSNTGHPNAKLNNFLLLEPTMRKIGVHFNSKVVSDIMTGKGSSVKNLLYEMKTQLESIYRNSQQNVKERIKGTPNDKAFNVIPHARPSYDNTKLATFSNAIHAKIENTNEVMLEKVLSKHTLKGKDYLDTMSAADSDYYKDFMDQKSHGRDMERSKKSQALETYHYIESQHIAQWKTNQRVAHERKARKLRVESDLTQRREALQMKVHFMTQSKTMNSIDNFDRVLEASLLVAGPDDKSESSAELVKTTTKTDGRRESVLFIDPLIQKAGLELSQKKMKEHQEDLTIKQQEHDQRRRKFFREYDTMQAKMSSGIFNNEVIGKVLDYSKIEVIENTDKDKVVKYKDIIPDNRRNREELIEQISKVDADRLVEWKKIVADRELSWLISDARVSHTHRSNMLKSATKVANQQMSKDLCLDIIDKVLDVVDWVLSFRSIGIYNVDKNMLTSNSTNVDLISSTASTDEDAKVASSSTATAVLSDAVSPRREMVSPRSCRVGEVIPDEIWKDASKMFTSDLPISEALAPTQPLSVTSRLIPFSISHRPLCAPSDWLFKSPFHSKDQLVKSVDKSNNADGSNNESENSLAYDLSSMDTMQFIQSLNEANISIGSVSLGDPPVISVKDDTSSDLDGYLTPSWIFNTQPKHVLGETIISARCIVDPIPDEPIPILDMTHIPLRVAICSVSDLTRKKLAQEFQKQVPHITIIETSELVQQAYSHHLIKISSINLDVPVVPPVQDDVKSTGSTSEEQIVSSQVEALVSVSSSSPKQDEYDSMAAAIYDILNSGKMIEDEMYIRLILDSINKLPLRNNGFVLQDFPTTKKQGVMLFQAFSGINYDSHRPQPLDYESQYAPSKALDIWSYDIRTSGLDVVIHVETGDNRFVAAFNERATARLVKETGEIIYLNEEQVSIDGLMAIDDPVRPYLGTGIDLTMTDMNLNELLAFCKQIKLVDTVSLSEYSSIDEALQSKVSQIVSKYIPAENLLPKYFHEDDDPIVINALDANADIEQIDSNNDFEFSNLPTDDIDEAVISLEAIQDQAAALGEITSVSSQHQLKTGNTVDATSLEGDQSNTNVNTSDEVVKVEELYVYQMPTVINDECLIPSALANALVSMWNTSETQSKRKSNAFFRSFRDVRYQMTQRRRAAYDTMSCLLVKLDDRQEVFDEFRQKFNSIDANLRFDPDCIAELHLQKLELCENLIKTTESRKKEAEAYSNKIANDSVVVLLMHACRCEAVSILQSEFQKFFVMLHLVFDIFKATKGYRLNSRIANGLEETLAVTLPSLDSDNKGGKGKEVKKAGKDVKPGPVPFREPIAPVNLPVAAMQSIPDVNTTEESITDPKAKGKAPPAKDKKSMVGSDADPFKDLETIVRTEINNWTANIFKVNREVYDGDEALCKVLEHAIWYEAEKMLLSIDHIKSTLQSQVTWLSDAEREMILILTDSLMKRYYRELNSINQIIDYVSKQIFNANPLEPLLLVSPDSKPINNESALKELFQEVMVLGKLKKVSTHAASVTRPSTGEGHRSRPASRPPSAITFNRPLSSTGLLIMKAANEAQGKAPSRTSSGRRTEAPADSSSNSTNSANYPSYIYNGTSASVDGNNAGILSDDSVIDDFSEAALDNTKSNDMTIGPMKKSSSIGNITGSKRSSNVDITSRGTLFVGGGDKSKRRQSVVTHKEHTVSIEELARRKAHAIYVSKRTEFMASLDTRRNEREKEFKRMGMTASVAKLAAFNDLHLQDDQDLEDFDMMHKPRNKKNFHKLTN